MNSTEGAEAVPWGELNLAQAKRSPLSLPQVQHLQTMSGIRELVQQ